MDALYTTIYEFLTYLLPSGVTTFDDLNSVAAYFLTLTLIWLILVKPIIKLFSLKGGSK